ncbi:MAG: sigma 54-interacting transcriptional regulator [Deltaproteobacteria bacterium]|jgi:PAS domain S-box-containing protein|nr:sigma 54-interacting transcriptional regulator [Deltaproteobacteria bacterium]
MAHLDQLNERIRQLELEIAESRKAIGDIQREQLFSEKVLDSLPGIFYLYDEDGNLIRWNKEHETLTGYNAEELPARSMLEWFSGTDKTRVAERVNLLFENGGRVDVEAHLIIKSGQKIPYYFTGVRMTVDGRRYLLGVGIDLTDLKKTEEALRKSEEKYRAIFENAVEGIYQTTPEGELVNANPAMARMLNYPSVDALLASVKDISKDLYVSRLARQKFIGLLRRNQPVSGYEVEFNRRGGQRIWISLNARPIVDGNGELRLIEGIIHDITEKKRQADALREREAYLRKENIRLRSNIKDRYRFGDIIGKSPAMQEVYELILKASATNANVIVYGESGTGKELVAHAIHELSDRKDGRFIPVNCGAIPDNLLESEFFGYRKGAFSGAATDKDGFLDRADGGTLFLDELGEIGPNLQVKLLRVLEGGGYTPIGGHEVKKPDVRIIAATNRDLQAQVNRGIMREDFFYRIHIIPIQLPPLRERKEDIPLLIEHFMKQAGGENNQPPITGEMLEAMVRHNWPGNVRELQNVLQRHRSLNRFDLLKGAPRQPFQEKDRIAGLPIDAQGESFQAAMARCERHLLLKVLENNQWQREVAAQALGLPLRTFYRKLKKHGLIRHKKCQI